MWWLSALDNGMPLAAVIFDFDGVVIDSHEAHERSWCALADELDRPFTRETFVATFGQRNESILPLLGWAEEGDKTCIKQLGDRTRRHSTAKRRTSRHPSGEGAGHEGSAVTTTHPTESLELEMPVRGSTPAPASCHKFKADSLCWSHQVNSQ